MADHAVAPANRLHHIGVGADRRGTQVILLVDDLDIRVIGRDTGELIRELIEEVALRRGV